MNYNIIVIIFIFIFKQQQRLHGAIAVHDSLYPARSELAGSRSDYSIVTIQKPKNKNDNLIDLGAVKEEGKLTKVSVLDVFDPLSKMNPGECLKITATIKEKID